MRLAELEPQFLRVVDPKRWAHVDSIAEADGIFFQCPVCWLKNQGPTGTHGVVCWRPRVPQTVHPVPGRWEFQGGGYGNLTLVAGSSSVLLMSGCKAHFFVRAGEIIIT